MKRLALGIVALVLPVALFAQTMHDHRDRFLKSLNLSDSQISQVQSVEKSTRTKNRQAFAHVRVLKAEIAEALLADTIDTDKVDGLIDQAAQTVAGIQKNRIATLVQLKQIMGDDAFQRFLAVIHHRRHHGFRMMRWQRPPRPVPMKGWQGGDQGRPGPAPMD